MRSSINLFLTDELWSFVSENCGDGSLYATPSEFVLDLIREKKQRQEAGRMRDSIIAGYQDAIEGKTHKFNGDLQALLEKVK